MIQHLKLATSPAARLAIVTAALATLVAFGVHLTEVQVAAILGLAAAIERLFAVKA